MKAIKIVLVLAAASHVGDGATQTRVPSAYKERPVFSSLPAQYQTLLATWLNQDCRVDSASIERDMGSAGQIVEKALWEAIDLGPTEEDRADLEHTLGARYALRLRWLTQSGPEAIDPSVSMQLLAESEEQFRATEMAKLNHRWRDAAVAGLGLVCTNRSLKRLKVIAESEQDPSSIAASEALRASRNCTSRVRDQLDRAQ
jgi:hypothetical protein